LGLEFSKRQHFEMRDIADHRPRTTTESDAWLRCVSIVGSALFFLSLISYNFVDIDIWHQMALIRESVKAGHLLRADPFAYTPTITPWIDHEWGAGGIAYFATLWLGGRILLILKFLLAAGTFAACWRCATELGADHRITSLCALLAVFLAYLGFFATIRAQVYSFFFTALLMLFWQKDTGRSGVWLLGWLFVFAVWVNLHGGFVVGIGLTALYCIERVLRGESYRRLLVALLAMTLEIFFTPYGTSYFGYLGRALWMARPYAPEWRPVWDLGPLWVICFLVAVITVGYAVASIGVRRTPGILPLLGAAGEALLHRKLLPVFAVVWFCCAPFYLHQTPAGQWLVQFAQRRRRFVLAAWTVLALAGSVAAARQKAWELRVPQPIYPVGAVQYLAQQRFQGNVMVPFRVGAYLSWKLYPAVKVSLDGRYEEVYSDEVMRRIFDFYEARPGWQDVLSSYPTDVVVVPRDSPVYKGLRETAWSPVYEDMQFVLYAKPGLEMSKRDDSARSFAGVFP
jgi:hypothetical protein